MRINPISNLQHSQNFNGGMHVNSRHAQWLIVSNCNARQLEKIKDIFAKQKSNILYCFIYSYGKGKRLEARLMCEKYISNFKDSYKQIPIFESKSGFIKRLSNRMDMYQKQLQDAAKKSAEVLKNL